MVGFVLLVAAVPVAAYFVLRWYAYDNWIVTAQGDQVVVKQGQQGGVLWFHPKVVDRTGVHDERDPPRCGGPGASGRAGVVAGRGQELRTSEHDHRDHDDHDDHHADRRSASCRPDHDAHGTTTTTTTSTTPATAAP